MIKSSTSKLESFDPEIERTFRRLRDLVESKASPQKQRQEMEESPAHRAAIGAGVGIRAKVEQPAPRSLMDYAQPSLTGTASYIRRPSVHANNFEPKPSYVQMIQNSV